MKYLSPIDPHVHLRWNEYEENFMLLAFRDAKAVGLRAIIGQGNTNPPLTKKDNINNYFKRADKYREDIEFTIHGVLTQDQSQQIEMFDLVSEENSRVASVKIFYAGSTNSRAIEIIDEEYQRASWELGSRYEFNGNRTGHFEDENLFKYKFFPKSPLSHSLRQSSKSEVVQFERQFRNAYDFGFKGNFIVFHTSNPETIDLGNQLIKKHNPEFNLFFEVTWHHMFLNWEDYHMHGNRVKMNPPLRNRKMQEDLLNKVLSGEVHMIGTDHAPHPLHRKDDPKFPASGIPVIAFWPKGIELLRKEKIPEVRLDGLIFYNANKLYFNNRLKSKTVDVKYQPKLWETYGFNPFSRIDGS